MAAKKQIKKDFSKEAMYRKIMPSISTPIEIGESFEGPEQDDGFQIPEHVPYNVMELVLHAKLPQIMDTLGACTCEQCRFDATALALNALEPVYMVCDAARAREKALEIRSKNEMKITAAAIRAVQNVMANPRH